MSLTIASINVERSEHRFRVARFIHQVKPDVLCLQELTRADIPFIEAQMDVPPGTLIYAPCMHYPFKPVPDQIGIAIVARHPLQRVTIATIGGTPVNPADDVPDVFQERVIFVTVPDEDKLLRIGTTHLNVTKEGMVTPSQMRSVRKLTTTALREVTEASGLLLTGDFNAPRHREAHNHISSAFIDGVPAHYRTSIDNELHKYGRKKPINFVVDGLFHTANYQLKDATLHSGVSDHMALTATLSQR